MQGNMYFSQRRKIESTFAYYLWRKEFNAPIVCFSILSAAKITHIEKNKSFGSHSALLPMSWKMPLCNIAAETLSCDGVSVC